MVMTLRQDKWADMTALNTMPPVAVEIEATQTKIGKESHVTIRLHNPSGHIAFFERATISTARDGNEILPIEYDDNYITVFPGETTEIHGIVRKGTKPRWVKLEGYNTPPFPSISSERNMPALNFSSIVNLIHSHPLVRGEYRGELNAGSL